MSHDIYSTNPFINGFKTLKFHCAIILLHYDFQILFLGYFRQAQGRNTCLFDTFLYRIVALVITDGENLSFRHIVFQRGKHIKLVFYFVGSIFRIIGEDEKTGSQKCQRRIG